MASRRGSKTIVVAAGAAGEDENRSHQLGLTDLVEYIRNADPSNRREVLLRLDLLFSLFRQPENIRRARELNVVPAVRRLLRTRSYPNVTTRAGLLLCQIHCPLNGRLRRTMCENHELISLLTARNAIVVRKAVEQLADAALNPERRQKLIELDIHEHLDYLREHTDAQAVIDAVEKCINNLFHRS